MRLTLLQTGTGIALAWSIVTAAHAAAHSEMKTATANVADNDGNEIGTVEFTETASGQMLIVWSLESISPGVHGVHVHETGDCTGAEFTSAGGHLSGDTLHGVLVDGGTHPGDLPNAHVGADGSLIVEYFDERLTMDMLGDADGAAVIVHSGADDYESQPAGDAGGRVACGVIETGA